MSTSIITTETKIPLVQLSKIFPEIPPTVFVTPGGLFFRKIQENTFEHVSRKFDAKLNQSVLLLGPNVLAVEIDLQKAVSIIDESAYEQHAFKL